MKILVAYAQGSTHTQTTLDYLNSFQGLFDGDVQYINVVNSELFNVDLSLYDVIIVSYCARLSIPNLVSEKFRNALSNFQGIKVIAVQDEYENTNYLIQQLIYTNFDLVLTCVPENQIHKVYPLEKLPNTKFFQVLTGYVPKELSDLNPKNLEQFSNRKNLLSYRGRDLGPTYGKLGYLKSEIGIRFKQECEVRTISHDISIADEDRIYGEEWYHFISNTKCMLGSESGSNLFDFDGSLKETYSVLSEKLNKKITVQEFTQIIQANETDFNMGQISPRVFECAALMTPMALIRGNYSGALIPGIHYIPINDDFSNMDEVFELLKDTEFLIEMAKRTRHDLIDSATYSYKSFNLLIQEQIEKISVTKYKKPIYNSLTHLNDDYLIPDSEIEVPTSSPKSYLDFEKKQLVAEIAIYKKDLPEVFINSPEFIRNCSVELSLLEQYVNREKLRSTREKLETLMTHFEKMVLVFDQLEHKQEKVPEKEEISKIRKVAGIYRSYLEVLYSLQNQLQTEIATLKSKRSKSKIRLLFTSFRIKINSGFQN